jgi:hypothetical protein
MKKIITLICAVSLSLALINCKKEDNSTNNNPNNSNVSNKVKTAIHTYYSAGSLVTRSTSYSYDGQGRVTLIQEYNQTTSYSYSGNTVQEIKSIFSMGVNDTVVYTLNSSGLATSGSGSTTQIVCSYNTDGYLVEQINCNIYMGSSYCDTVRNVIQNGNITSTIKSYGTSVFTMGSETDNRDFGLSIFGKTNKNVIQTETYSGTGNYVYTYERDSSHRIIKQIIVADDITTYTY